jgi:hypothetical protein
LDFLLLSWGIQEMAYVENESEEVVVLVGVDLDLEELCEFEIDLHQAPESHF